MRNTYYPTQLSEADVQEKLMQEYQLALAHFPGAVIIPGNVEIWSGFKLGACMVQLFRANGKHYVVYCVSETVKQIDAHSVEAVCVKVSPVTELVNWGSFPYDWRVKAQEAVYAGAQWYCCESPLSIRAHRYRATKQKFWYFTDFATPEKILTKIVQRRQQDHEPIMTIKLKTTPYKGYKKNAVYKRFASGFWVLVNKNGKESTYYSLTKK